MTNIKYDSICRAGKIVNEDILYTSESMGWVLDAATGLAGKNLTSGETDGAWFVKQWDEYLKKNIENLDKSIKEIVYDGIDVIKECFYKEANITEIESILRPSASLVLFRINNEMLEYFLLGDCTLLIQSKDGSTIRVKDTRLEAFDGKAAKCMNEARIKDSLTFEEAREFINPMLIEHRLLKNKPEGYWTLEFEKESANNGIEGSMNIGEISAILMLSDGYAAIYDVYKECNELDLIDVINKDGLETVYNRIREIEEEDKDCSKFPRFKKGDDASAVLIEIK